MATKQFKKATLDLLKECEAILRKNGNKMLKSDLYDQLSEKRLFSDQEEQRKFDANHVIAQNSKRNRGKRFLISVKTEDYGRNKTWIHLDEENLKAFNQEV